VHNIKLLCKTSGQAFKAFASSQIAHGALAGHRGAWWDARTAQVTNQPSDRDKLTRSVRL